MAAVYWWAAWNVEYHQFDIDFQEGVDLAKSYLKTAMESPSALGHRIRAEMYRWEGKFDSAVTEADKAIRLDSNNPEGYEAKAYAQIRAGQADLALKNFDVADRLDPGASRPEWHGRGVANLILGNYEEAARLLELVVAAEPDFQYHYPWLISAYGHLDRQAEAKIAIKKLNEIWRVGSGRRYTLAHVAGRTDFKSKKDQANFFSGLIKAGVEPGSDYEAAKIAMDTLVSRTSEGRYKVQGATTVDAARAKSLLDDGIVMFDMRGNGSWQSGHIDGALHARKLIAELTEENLATHVGKTEGVAFYCSGFT
jgi:tetratricopeptide (TPR) repeat protein